MSEKRSVLFNLRVTPTEYGWWKEAAAAAGMSLSEWLRGNATNAVAQKAGVTNPGSVLTEGGGVTATTRAATQMVGPELRISVASGEGNDPDPPLSVNTEETILSEATALIRDKEGVQHRVDLLERSGKTFHPDPKPAGRKKKR